MDFSVGTDNIEPPANFSHSSDNNIITFTWDHLKPSLVEHYEMVLDCIDQTLVFRLERNRFSLTLPCGPNSPYTATLTAVSVCGRKSTHVAVSREGM